MPTPHGGLDHARARSPHRIVLCLPLQSGHGRREIVEETDLSVSRQLGNPVAGWGHHEAPGVAGIRAIQTHANQVPYHRGSLERMARGGWQLAKGMAFAVGLPIRCMYRCTE